MGKAINVFTSILLAAHQCLATDEITPDKIEALIHTDELQRNLWNLNHIADTNGGNRAFGLPGYKASVDFVLERAQIRFASEMDTYVQSFNRTYSETRDISVTGPEGEDVHVITLLYNQFTPLPGGITASLIDTPVDDENGSGCLAEAWEGIDATGKIALVKRGTCSTVTKIGFAKAHGAVAVLIYNNAPGNDYGSVTLGVGSVGTLVPAGIVPLEIATAWKARLAAGEDLVVTLLVDSIFEERETWNVFAETKEGDPNNVVMLGAHLDSVQAGPGINDDGSGSSALLEIMGAVKSFQGFPNKIRFAWWAAEENGLLGSRYYTSTLTSEEADKIRFYFNYDMIGSIQSTYSVYQQYEGDQIGAQALADYLVSQGKEPVFLDFEDDDSDYEGFVNLGIPSSGIFTGSGAPEDPCYHLACDTVDNIDYDALTVNARAAGRVATQFALSLEGVPPRSPPAPERRGATAGVKRTGRLYL